MNERSKIFLAIIILFLPIGVYLFGSWLGFDIDFSQPKAAEIAPQHFSIDFSNPGSYDILPTIMYDQEENIWKAWWCGIDTGIGGDGVWYATSTDKISWAQPRQVIKPTRNVNDWDGHNNCAVSVVKHPRLSGSDWKYAMYYEAAKVITDPLLDYQADSTRIGLAVSNDGISWEKYSGNPIMGDKGDSEWCGPLHVPYGCGHPNVVRLPDKFIMAYVHQSDPYDGPIAWQGIRIAESVDGFNFTKDKTLCLMNEFGGCYTGSFGDIMYDPDPNATYHWYVTLAGSAEYLVGMPSLDAVPCPAGANILTPLCIMNATLLGTYYHNPYTSVFNIQQTDSFGGGFYRLSNGYKPSGDIRTLISNKYVYLENRLPNSTIQERSNHLLSIELTGINWGNPNPISPTPTPVVKSGDIDGDQDIDIFDYNLLVVRFGQSGNFPEDINKDGKVDIFDYNILVGNFGS